VTSSLFFLSTLNYDARSTTHQGTCMLIDAAISGNRNEIKKEAEKAVKHEDPITEYQRMWNVKVKNDIGNDKAEWNHFKITQTILE